MDPPGESHEFLKRIQPIPRPLKEIRVEALPPEPPPPPEPEPAPFQVGPKPDRSRMPVLVLDPAAANKQLSITGAKPKGRIRTRSNRTRKWARQGKFLVKLGLILATLFWVILTLNTRLKLGLFKKQKPVPSLSTGLSPASPVQLDLAGKAGMADRALQTARIFLAAPDVRNQSLHVLDRDRVLPLMLAASSSGAAPDAQLRLGVPRSIGPGLTLIPAQGTAQPDLLLHLLLQEKEGKPLLDWETYHQDATQRFLKFAAHPGTRGGDFRLVLERVHGFGAPGSEQTAVRVSPLGNPALADPVRVVPEAVTAITAGLPWEKRSRAMVRLEWESPAGQAPQIVLRELVHWDFLP